MKILISFCAAICLLAFALPAIHAEPNNAQLLPGTQIHLTLLNTLSTAVARDGDLFIAVVAEPVYYGGQIVLPAGARIHGQVGTVIRPKRFSMFRGQAYLNLAFRSIEMDSRIIPAQMSILAIRNPSSESNGKRRKDIKVVEGQVVEAKHDIKGDVVAATVGTGGGTLAGAVFSHVARGFGIGLAGSTAYILTRKGKDVELPAQTGILVRLDNTISVPITAANNNGYSSGTR